MCGIAGFLEARRQEAAEAREMVRRMTQAIAHRGPDAEGIHAEDNVGLGQRRLAIIDLTDAGGQPMVSHDGRWVLNYNGEIYNFQELRGALEAQKGPIDWRGHSDTEVLLECFAAWGVEPTLKKLNGMFAILLWDRQEKALFLARDPLGEKPLYYGWQNSTFLFGSELKALAAHPAFERRLERGALGPYLGFAYVPAPLSIWRGILKLPPGHWMRMDAAARPGEMPQTRAYWALPRPDPRACDEAEALDELDALLRDAVKLRMFADVPTGAFLSGGIDSSTIVSLMQAQASQPVRTFSIGFGEQDHDESRHAAAVSAHLGTQHMALRVTGQDALAVVPLLPDIYDEPFADSSQIPTYLLSKLTRQHVTVSLSGDGGDEVFAGYTRYFTFDALWAKIARIPGFLRGPVAGALSALPASTWRNLPGLPANLRREIQGERLNKLVAAMHASSPQDFYASLTQFWRPGEMTSASKATRPPIFFEQNDIADFAHPALGMSYVDMGSYLPDDILAKVDRASMAVSLEARVPILDPRVVEFAATLPLDLKLRHGQGKYLLRRLLDRHVPRALIDRPKKGFSIPLDEWLRGPLKAWGESLIEQPAEPLGGLLNLSAMCRLWRAHQDRRRNAAQQLWIVLVLLDWARRWRPA